MLISGFLYNIIYYWLRWLYRYWYIYTAIYCDLLRYTVYGVPYRDCILCILRYLLLGSAAVRE